MVTALVVVVVVAKTDLNFDRLGRAGRQDDYNENLITPLSTARENSACSKLPPRMQISDLLQP